MLRKIVRVFPVVLAIAVLASPAAAGDLEQNKAVARTALEEILGRGRIDENEAIYAPDYVSHGGGRDVGRVQDRETVKGWRQAFPDLRLTIDKIVAEGDLVAVRFLAEGTNTGSGNGLQATGKPIRMAAMTILRIVDGKIVEEWPMFDQLDLLRQLGLMPMVSK